MTPFRENIRGIVAITACNFLFLLNDTQVKLVSVDLPLGEIIFLRGICATCLLAPFVIYTRAHVHLPAMASRAFVVRTVAEVLAAYLFLIALFHIPIANANTILQVVPLAITAAAAIVFREPVGWRRWTAIAIGFLGVLVVIRPGFSGFNAYSLLTLISVLFITLRDVTTRMMPRGIPALAVAQVTAIAVCLTGPLWSLISGEQWVMPAPRSLALVAGAAAFLIGGYLTAVVFMRHGDIAVVAPFRYTVIVWAMLVGYFVWHDVPDAPMILGSAIIIATGVYTFHRERRLAIRASVAAISE